MENEVHKIDEVTRIRLLGIARIVKILSEQFGTPTWEKRKPVDELIITLLSQNTHNGNRDRAYQRLRDRFHDWDSLLEAGVDEIEEAIRPAGLSRQKSARILEILEWIRRQYGGLNLDALSESGDQEAIRILTSRKGIGVKTAAVVLAFAFDRDLCPVDTHVHRISKRLGWIHDSTSAEKTFWILKDYIPRGTAATFHLNLLKFGRTICMARNPFCGECPLWNDCLWEKKTPPNQ